MNTLSRMQTARSAPLDPVHLPAAPLVSFTTEDSDMRRAANQVRVVRGILRSAQSLQELGKHLRCPRSDVAALQVARITRKIADEASGLQDQQSTRRHVPGRQAHLPESVEPPGGDIGEVERRCAGPPHARARSHDPPELSHVRLEAAQLAKRKAGADQRVLEAPAARYADPPVVEKRAAPARRGEELVLGRIVDDRMDRLAALLDRDRNAILRKSVDEI